MRLLRRAWAFLVKDFRVDLSYRLGFLGNLVFVVFMVSAFYFLARMLEGQDLPALRPYGGRYFPFVLTGVAFSSYLGVALRTFAEAIRSAQVLGTLEALLVTPTPVAQIVFLSSLYAFLATSLRVVLTLAVGALFFGVRFPGANWGGALLVLLLSVLAFSFLGILSASVVLVFKRGDPSAGLVQGLSYLLGGVYYPVAVLPGWAQLLAQALPITHALEAIRRLLLQGASLGEAARPILALAVFSAVAGPLALTAFWLALRQVRKDGSLSQF